MAAGRLAPQPFGLNFFAHAPKALFGEPIRRFACELPTAAMAYGYGLRTMVTGQWARSVTSRDTEPSISRFKPPFPVEPTTM